MRFRILAATLLLSLAAQAAVQKVYLDERTDVLDGKSFGPAGPYERVKAKAYFAVDPTLAANKIITDIALAPRNAEGLVEFSADIYVLKPRDSAKGNGTVLYEVPNRGGKGLLSMFDHAQSSLDPRTQAELGDSFLLEQGYTIVWVGWQFDVPRRAGLLRLYAPQIKGVTGTVRAEFTPNAKATLMPLADRDHIPYPAIDRDEPALKLTVRDRADTPRRTIPRAQWKFKDESTIEMATGFTPGKFYEIVYKSTDPTVVGLGPTAVRDFISFLKYGGAETLLGDQRRYIKRAIGFGTSQSGRFLRTFLYYGFNADEKDKKVFDGVWAHVAGAGRGSFNHRFAQASRDGHRMLNSFYPTDIFPFADLPETDAETGQTGSILAAAEKSNVVPKIFYTNGSYEYWGRAASLIHTTPDGKQDAPLAPDTRIYYLTGTQHGPGNFPPRRGATQNDPNVNDYRYMMRALLVSMNNWVTTSAAPPASQYPRISKDQLVSMKAVQFPKIPGVQFPLYQHTAWRADFGPEFASKVIVTIDPPKLGKPFPVLVPQVNMDGNETAGIRMPEIAVPLGTYTGWNMRDAKIGAPDETFDMAGSWIPFAWTKAQREAKKDPRLSIEERYKDRQEYLVKIRAAADGLVAAGYLLSADIEKVVARSAQEWDTLAAAAKLK
jgi:hypothetical protein